MSRLGLSSVELAARLRDVVRGPLAVDGQGGLRLDPARVLWPLRVRPDGYLALEQMRPRKATAAVTANYGDLILADPTSAGFTITLPGVADKPGGQIVVKNKSASTNSITIDGRGSEEIDGSTTLIIASAWASRTLISDGSMWVVL